VFEKVRFENHFGTCGMKHLNSLFVDDSAVVSTESFAKESSFQEYDPENSKGIALALWNEVQRVIAVGFNVWFPENADKSNILGLIGRYDTSAKSVPILLNNRR